MCLGPEEQWIVLPCQFVSSSGWSALQLVYKPFHNLQLISHAVFWIRVFRPPFRLWQSCAESQEWRSGVLHGAPTLTPMEA